MKRVIIIALVSLAAIVLYQDFLKSKSTHAPVAPRPYVVVLSLDGFRWDYQQKAATPHLDSITKYGVKAKGLQPIFPSSTFPNHYALSTGLYAENHGIVANSFYTPKLHKAYAMDDTKAVAEGGFYLGEPLWVTAESNRVKAATYFWVGSEAKIKGYRPSYYKKYAHTFPYAQRIDSVISWLDLPYQQRPHLVMWYLDAADGLGHTYGPDSPEVAQGITQLDSLLGVFLRKAEALSIADSINFVLVSDHGMSASSAEKTIYLNDYLKEDWVATLYGANPYYLVHPAKKAKDSILAALQGVEGLNVMTKENIPERFHFKNINRVPELFILADSSWSIYPRKGEKTDKGVHGYDNTFRDMYGIFYACGPAFKQGYAAGDLRAIDLYSLLSHILELKPAETDGSLDQIQSILKEK